MSTYELPREPDVDVLWTTSSSGVSQPVVTRKWQRVMGSRTLWCEFGGSPHADRFSWHRLLGFGVVHDQHPGLCGVPPTPWEVELDDVRTAGVNLVVDAGGDSINLYDNATLSLIVRAVNAYAEGLR